MNPTLASLPIDTNTLILIVIAVGSGITSWIEKRRKAAAAEKARNQGASPQPSTTETASAPPNMEEILRRLLGGEQPPSESTPPLAQSSEQPVYEEPVVIPRAQPSETVLKRDDGTPSISQRTSRHIDLAPVRNAKPVLTIAERAEKHMRRSGLVAASEKISAAVPAISRRQRSPEAERAIAMVRNPRAARTAFIASLVFGPPKSLENSQP